MTKPRYSDEQLNELKRLVPIWKAAAGRVRGISKTGEGYLGHCPFHDDKNPSFGLYQKDGIGLWNCLSGKGCGSGNIFQLVSKCDSIDFNTAVEKVAEMAGWELGKRDVEQTFTPIIGKATEPKVTFPLEKFTQAEEELQKNPRALRWLSERGITLEAAASFHLGFVPSCSAVVSNHPWENDGWIVFPTIEGDAITCLKYRSVKGKKTPDGQAAILRKKGMSTSLYNGQAINPFEDVFVVEGEPDTLIVAQAGYVAASIPSAGFAITPEMRDQLVQASRIYLAGDMDGVGQETMHKLWAELKERTYLIKWPDGCKDANETFLKQCNGDVAAFRVLIEELKQKAHESPMPFMYSLKESMLNADTTKPLENPNRLHFPWSNIDSWTAVLPGDVACLFATETGTGKTTMLMAILLENAIKHGRTIVNYSAELLPPQYTRRAVSYLTEKKRDELEKEDYLKAAELMGDARFYNGYKPKANYKEVIETVIWAKRRLGADIIAIDHLMFLTRSEKDEIKAQSEAMRMLKDVAVEYNCIVIVVGQPRKFGKQQQGREAVTQDAKGSEAIGSDSSQVFIMHRDRMPGAKEGEPIFSPVTKIKLDKSRESGTMVTNLLFRGDVCRFEMMTDKEVL